MNVASKSEEDIQALIKSVKTTVGVLNNHISDLEKQIIDNRHEHGLWRASYIADGNPTVIAEKVSMDMAWIMLQPKLIEVGYYHEPVVTLDSLMYRTARGSNYLAGRMDFVGYE